MKKSFPIFKQDYINDFQIHSCCPIFEDLQKLHTATVPVFLGQAWSVASFELFFYFPITSEG